VAENYMMEDLLLPAFTSTTSDHPHIMSSSFTSDLIYYQPTQGREDLRRVLCESYLPFLLQLNSSSSSNTSLNPNNLVVGAGCNAVLENTCLCLAEFGQGVMIPTPYYAAFEFDLTCRIGKYYN
jgi:aspartate/methionine/tyrosine aminotransferase